MNLTLAQHYEIFLANRSLSPQSHGPVLELIHRPVIPLQVKPLTILQILEISLTLIIFLEHSMLFLLTFRKKKNSTTKTTTETQTDQNVRSIILPRKSYLYTCLHRNWIRAFSLSNLCLASVYFIISMIKHYYPNLIHYSSNTYYSLPLKLMEQILINFSTFHLFLISISLFQYLLRYDRILKNSYSQHYFNGQSFLVTKHTNVALILSGSLALILAYNFIFYNPTYPQTNTLLPLVAFNMLLLPLINLLILAMILTYGFLHFCCRSKKEFSHDPSEQTLRFLIEKSACAKCCSKIVEKNSHLFQDKDHSYGNYLEKLSLKHLRSFKPIRSGENLYSYWKKLSSAEDLTMSMETRSPANLFFRRTLMKLNRQHHLCHRCHQFLLILLLKYVFFTSPQFLMKIIFYFKQFAQLIFKWNFSKPVFASLNDSVDPSLLIICHFLFLFARLGDCFLLTRFSSLIQNYFPCWCQCHSNYLQREEISHQILSTKTSQSSSNEQPATINVDPPITTEISSPSTSKQKHRRHYRLKFQYLPLWSNDRPRLFKGNI